MSAFDATDQIPSTPPITSSLSSHHNKSDAHGDVHLGHARPHSSFAHAMHTSDFAASPDGADSFTDGSPSDSASTFSGMSWSPVSTSGSLSPSDFARLSTMSTVSPTSEQTRLPANEPGRRKRISSSHHDLGMYLQNAVNPVGPEGDITDGITSHAFASHQDSSLSWAPLFATTDSHTIVLHDQSTSQHLITGPPSSSLRQPASDIQITSDGQESVPARRSRSRHSQNSSPRKFKPLGSSNGARSEGHTPLASPTRPSAERRSRERGLLSSPRSKMGRQNGPPSMQGFSSLHLYAPSLAGEAATSSIRGPPVLDHSHEVATVTHTNSAPSLAESSSPSDTSDIQDNDSSAVPVVQKIPPKTSPQKRDHAAGAAASSSGGPPKKSKHQETAPGASPRQARSLKSALRIDTSPKRCGPIASIGLQEPGSSRGKQTTAIQELDIASVNAGSVQPQQAQLGPAFEDAPTSRSVATMGLGVGFGLPTWQPLATAQSPRRSSTTPTTGAIGGAQSVISSRHKHSNASSRIQLSLAHAQKALGMGVPDSPNRVKPADSRAFATSLTQTPGRASTEGNSPTSSVPSITVTPPASANPLSVARLLYARSTGGESANVLEPRSPRSQSSTHAHSAVGAALIALTRSIESPDLASRGPSPDTFASPLLGSGFDSPTITPPSQATAGEDEYMSMALESELSEGADLASIGEPLALPPIPAAALEVRSAADAKAFGIISHNLDTILAEFLRVTDISSSKVLEISRKLVTMLDNIIQGRSQAPRIASLLRDAQVVIEDTRTDTSVPRPPSASAPLTRRIRTVHYLPLAWIQAEHEKWLERILDHVATGILALLNDERSPYDIPHSLARLVSVVTSTVSSPPPADCASEPEYAYLDEDGSAPMRPSQEDLAKLVNLDSRALFASLLVAHLDTLLQTGQDVRGRVSHLNLPPLRRGNKKRWAAAAAERAALTADKEALMQQALKGLISEEQMRKQERIAAAQGHPKHCFAETHVVRFVGLLYIFGIYPAEKLQKWLQRLLFETVHPDVPSIYELEAGCALLITVGPHLELQAYREKGWRRGSSEGSWQRAAARTPGSSSSMDISLPYSEPVPRPGTPIKHWINHNLPASRRSSLVWHARSPLRSATSAAGLDDVDMSSGDTCMSDLETLRDEQQVESELGAVVDQFVIEQHAASANNDGTAFATPDLASSSLSGFTFGAVAPNTAPAATSEVRAASRTLDGAAESSFSASRVLELCMSRIEETRCNPYIVEDAQEWLREVLALRERNWQQRKAFGVARSYT